MSISLKESNHIFNYVNDYFNQGDYHQAAELLEEYIENDPEEVNYYWYLGLAYLLQEQEENAQMTWLLVISQGERNEIEQWTKELLIILETESQRQEKIGNLKLSWLIRGHIREIEPGLINNLLHLINLEIKLQYYEPEHLENWQIVDYLNNNVNEAVDLELFLKILPHILDFPFVVNINLLNTFLKYITLTNIDTFISILKLKAIIIAYDNGNPNYALELVKICLYLKPNNLELLDWLYRFSTATKDYIQRLQSAEKFLDQAKSHDFKAFGYFKIIHTFIDHGEWLKAQEILPNYIISLHKVISLKKF